MLGQTTVLGSYSISSSLSRLPTDPIQASDQGAVQ